MNDNLTFQNVAKSTNSTFVLRSLQGLALTPTVLYLLWYIKLKETPIRHQRANVTVEKRTNGIPESCLIPEALQGKNCLRTPNPNNLKGNLYTYIYTLYMCAWSQTEFRVFFGEFRLQLHKHFSLQFTGFD